MAVVTLEGGPLSGANMTISDNCAEIHYPVMRVAEGFRWSWEHAAFVWFGEGEPDDRSPAWCETVVYHEVRPGVFGVKAPKRLLGE